MPGKAEFWRPVFCVMIVYSRMYLYINNLGVFFVPGLFERKWAG